MSTRPMTQERLDAIRERVDKATKGRWDYAVTGKLAAWDGNRAAPVIDFGKIYPEDAEFIIHAREDVPALLAEVERLRNDLAKAREVTDDMIERAAVQMCSNGRNATIWANYLYEDERESFREDARAALDAALNPGEGS